MSSKHDPTEAMRLKASLYPRVDEGTACTQSSFKANSRGFLYIGKQGGRFKAMFKLKESLEQAASLEKEAPEDFQVGSGGWVTVRFSEETPIPEQLWQSWLDESYTLTLNSKKKA